MNEIVLSVQDLTAGYADHEILREVSFSVQTGEMIGLIGPNGAGKSTLLKTIRGMLPALAGNICLFSRDIHTLTPRDFARCTAYLPQQMVVPFAYTVRDIVMAGRYPYLSWWQHTSRQDRQVAEACMAYTGVLSLAEQPVNALSGGQRQRVLLAKILAQQTSVLLLDEPAAGLDLMYQEEIFRFCQDLCAAGRTVLLVVHELGLAARFCSRLLLTANGQLLADGQPAEVLTETLLEQAYGVPVRVSSNPRTGHADIYTVKDKADARQQQLLPVILGKDVIDCG